MNKRFCAWMLGLLAAGVLLIGIGVGVGLVEFAGFSYAGVNYLGDERKETPLEFTLPEGATLDIDCYIRGGRDVEPVFAEDESLEPGQFRIVTETIGLDTEVWMSQMDWSDGQTRNYVRLGCVSGGSSVEAVMLAKDRILQDIRDRRIGEYYVEKLESLTVYQAPADAGRVQVHMVR